MEVSGLGICCNDWVDQCCSFDHVVGRMISSFSSLRSTLLEVPFHLCGKGTFIVT